MKRAVIIIFILILLALIFLFGVYFKKPAFFLKDISSSFSIREIINENISLRKERDDLKNELYSLSNGFSLLKLSDELKESKVFSFYPGNTKNRIFINGGSDKNFVIGQGVGFSKTILLGKISAVFEDRSEVMTLFDPSFNLPVRIGKKEVDGILNGGVNPKIIMIDKTKPINVGDLIISASKDFLYGLEIGKVKSSNEDLSGSFFESVVELPYTLLDVRNVFIFDKK